MTQSRGVMRIVVVLIGLPSVLALAEAVAFHTHNRSNSMIVSSGLEREYHLYVPPSYDRTKPTPLVMTLHGGAMWPVGQMDVSPWNRVADEHGFISVYPSGVRGRGPRHWEAGGGPDQARDVLFISELIDTLAAHYNIDRSRVFANGLSNGGGMSFALACALSDRIAAVGLVSVAIFLPWRECTGTRPVPLIILQGTADKVPYEGGHHWVAREYLPHIPRWTATYARKNSCDATPIESRVAVDVMRREYTKCDDSAAVVLYTIEGGGHTWPGGTLVGGEWFVGRTSNSIDASEEMWKFFRAHPLRTTGVSENR